LNGKNVVVGGRGQGGLHARPQSNRGRVFGQGRSHDFQVSARQFWAPEKCRLTGDCNWVTKSFRLIA
jgi:hypothetical protein